MGNIRVLPEQIANKIAAGEVIERPASIVKELIENSIDAGATAIHIAVQHGGKSMIRVADNGCGMSAEDAELSLKRHATSKIREVSDLSGIGSFGFRGEALPSIAAVSRVRLTTRLRDAGEGTEVSVEGGRSLGVKPSGQSPGTIVEVRDLFFNTPARRKFMKADSTELGHILDTVHQIALSHPETGFVFESSGRQTLSLVPVNRVLERALQIYGGDTAGHWLEIDCEVPGIRVSGLIGRPFLARANRSGQAFFVNRRWIRSFPFSYALQAGYHGLMMQGQYPSAVLFIDLDLSRVDVNVHPTKQEVRIGKSQEVHSFIKKAVAETLMRSGDLSPALAPPSSMSGMPEGGTVSVSGGTAVRRKEDAYKQKQRPLESVLGVAESAAEPVLSREVAPQEAIAVGDTLQVTKILGQVHHTFILAETVEGLIVVDQHAAHERVMFEALMKNLTSGKPARQKLLMEEVLELHPRQTALFKDSVAFLEGLGFELDPFGPNSYVIRSCPSLLRDKSPTVYLKRYVEEKESGRQRASIENYQEEVAALIACKRRSVKAHDAMSPEAMRALLAQLASCDNPFSCPHGRPTLFKYSFEDLERQFKRK